MPWCSSHGGALGEAAAVRGRVVWHGTQPAIIRALYLSCAACCLTQRLHLPDIYITTLGAGLAPCRVYALANPRQSYSDRHVNKQTNAAQSRQTTTAAGARRRRTPQPQAVGHLLGCRRRVG